MNKFYIIIIILFTLLQNTFSQVSFSYDGNLCEESTINLYGESIVPVSEWSWEFGDGDISKEQNPSHKYTNSGTYTIKLSVVIESNGNSYSATQEIRISTNPTVGFVADSTQVYYSTYSRVFIDTSKLDNPASKFIWDFGDSSPQVSTDSSSTMYKYSEKGTYVVSLKVIDTEGCSDSISKTINIYDRYYIPNVFTPNGDGMNDQFVVTSNGTTLFAIEIYSRWGNIVFKRSGHQQIVWDGRMPEGTMVKPGTYFYVISSEKGDTTYEPEKGYITVLY